MYFVFLSFFIRDTKQEFSFLLKEKNRSRENKKGEPMHLYIHS